MHFLINRTDNIGDVLLTLPLAAQLKVHFPGCKVSMLARRYAKDIVDISLDIDTFLCSDDFFSLEDAAAVEYLRAQAIDVFLPVYPNERLSRLMKKAQVPLRVGHVNRFYHFFTANKLLHIKRKRCDLHQAQMCMQYLKAFNLPFLLPREALHPLIRVQPLPHPQVKGFLDPTAFNLVIHPGTNGHTIEWPKQHFAELIKTLPPQVKIYLTGSAKEGELYGDLALNERVVPLFGRMSLSELARFLAEVDGVIVGSTGPLHLAAALGTRVLGLFPAQQDLNIKRWGPLGAQASALEAPHCAISRPKDPKRCDCMKYITPAQVVDFVQKEWLNKILN